MNNLFKFFLIPFLLFLFFFNFYKLLSAGYVSTFDVDEHSWIARSYFLELFLKGDFDNPFWNTYGEEPAESVDGDPKLAPYVYGIFIYPEYLKEKKSKGNAKSYDMVKFLIDKNMMAELFMNRSSTKDYEGYKREADFINWNPIKASGRTFESLINEFGVGFSETADFILGLRTVSYIFTALSVVIGYFIVLTFTKGLPLSIFTAVFYGASRIVAGSTYYARTEGLFLFLFNLGIFFMIMIISRKVSNRWLVVFALDSALCNQTKLNGVILVLMFSLLAIFSKVLRPNYGEIAKKWLFNIILVNLLFALFYIGLNPSLYKNTLRNLGFQYSWTYKVASFLQNISPPEDKLDTPLERIRFVSKTFFWKRGILPRLPVRDKGSWIILLTPPLLLVFFVVGFLSLAAKTVAESLRLFKNAKFSFSYPVVFFFIFLMTFFSTSLYLILAWERYLVQLILPTWFVILYGIGVILDLSEYKYPSLKDFLNQPVSLSRRASLK